MACLNDYDYDVLVSHKTYEESEQFIRSAYWETYYFEPGYNILGLRLMGDRAVPVAVEDKTDDTLIFPYTKPCMGTFVIRIAGIPEEVKKVRTSYTKSLTLQQWSGSTGNRPAASAVTCPLDVSLRNFNYEIMSHFKTFKECERYIRSRFWETYYFEPDFRLLGLKPLGKDYIPVAICDKGDNNIVFPYHDSFMGALVILIKDVPDEVKRIRENYSRDMTRKKWAETTGTTVALGATGPKVSIGEIPDGSLKGLRYEVLATFENFRESEDYIRSKFWEVYYYHPGVAVLGLKLPGDKSVPIAIDDKSDENVIVSYSESSSEFKVIRILGVPDEVRNVRANYPKDLTLKYWKKSS